MYKHARPAGLKKYGTAKPWEYGMERAVPYLAPQDPSEKGPETPRMVSTGVGEVLLRKKSKKGRSYNHRGKKYPLVTPKKKRNR